MLSACYVLIIDLGSKKRLTSSKEDRQESCLCRAYILMWETGNKQSENYFGEKIKECEILFSKHWRIYISQSHMFFLQYYIDTSPSRDKSYIPPPPLRR